jgi:hypothetical protein
MTAVLLHGLSLKALARSLLGIVSQVRRIQTRHKNIVKFTESEWNQLWAPVRRDRSVCTTLCFKESLKIKRQRLGKISAVSADGLE